MKKAVKIILSLLAFVYILNLSSGYCGDGIQKVHVKKMQCNLSENYYHQNLTLTFKSVNRTCQMLSIVGSTKRAIDKAFVRDIKQILKS